MSVPNNSVSPVSLRWDMEVVNEEVGTTEAEIICGVGNDCIIFPDNNMAPTEVVTVNCHPEFLDIQVVEEEVVGESWEVAQASDGEILQVPIEQFKNPPVYEHDEVEIPLPEDQDSYTTMRPYPCDFCSRRFRKKANLTNHMIAHQSDRPHGCNLCGARYHRKSDLVTHMKIHAYAPGQEISDDDEMQYAYMQENNTKIKNRRKKSASPKKRKNPSPGYEEFNDDDFDVLDLQRQAKKKTSTFRSKNNSSSHNYVDEDMKLMMQSTSSYTRENIDRRPPKPRFTVTDESRPYVCQHCGVGFAREKALGSHSRIHAGDTAFECASCGELFWDSVGLKEHSRVKHGLSISFADEQPENELPYTGDERFGEFNCEICGLGFHRYDLLKRHRRVHVKSECAEVANTYVCQVCSNSFPDQADLLAHVETHARYQPHRCMLCGECFMDGPAVASHVRRKHAKDIPANACTQCGKTCKDRRSLQKHSWVHSVERSFSCFKCGKRFHSRARLKRHMVSHRDKAVSCDDCGEEFPDGRALINHRHSHTKDLSSRQFHCVECGKTFGSRSSQQIHARIHTGERPYGCRFCWKAFADGGTLRKHERIHTGEKPYACPICPRAFNQRVVLREHVRSHHSGPDRSGQLPLFLCKVCNASMLSSEELCAHLISHSDENTAKHRAPRVGPRKYKRRRKLNSYELNRIAGTSEEYGRGYGSGSDMDMDNVMTDHYSDEDDDDVVTAPKLSMKKKLKAKRKAATDRNLDTVVKTFESVVENFNFFVDSAQSDTKKSQKKKLKLKKKIASAETVDAVPDAGVANADASHVGGFVRTTRPSGQPRVRPRTKNVSVKTLAALKSVSATATAAAAATPPPEPDIKPPPADKNKVGPRTKNVSYHNVKLAKLPSATFPVEEKPAETKVVKGKAKRKAPVAKGRKKLTKKEVVPLPKRATNNGRSPSQRKTTSVRQGKSPTKAAPAQPKTAPPLPPQESSVNGNTYEDDEESLLPPIEYVEIKQEYACEMCGETFMQRADLLIHVPIHI